MVSVGLFMFISWLPIRWNYMNLLDKTWLYQNHDCSCSPDPGVDDGLSCKIAPSRATVTIFHFYKDQNPPLSLYQSPSMSPGSPVPLGRPGGRTGCPEKRWKNIHSLVFSVIYKVVEKNVNKINKKRKKKKLSLMLLRKCKCKFTATSE